MPAHLMSDELLSAVRDTIQRVRGGARPADDTRQAAVPNAASLLLAVTGARRADGLLPARRAQWVGGSVKYKVLNSTDYLLAIKSSDDSRILLGDVFHATHAGTVGQGASLRHVYVSSDAPNRYSQYGGVGGDTADGGPLDSITINTVANLRFDGCCLKWDTHEYVITLAGATSVRTTLPGGEACIPTHEVTHTIEIPTGTINLDCETGTGSVTFPDAEFTATEINCG